MKIDRVNSPGTIPNVENKTDSPETNTNTGANVEALDKSQLVKAVDTLNEKAIETNYDVRFAIYKDSNRIFVEVVDKANNQVISTFPPKQILEMALMVDKEFKVLDKKI
jgi:flagellar protein FlaG